MTKEIEGPGSQVSDAQLSGGVSGPAASDSSSVTGGPVATVCAAVKSGTSVVLDFIDRIVNGIRGIAPLVLTLGCQSTNEPANIAPPPAVKAQAPATVATEAPRVETVGGPRQLGQFSITFYYVVGEDELPAKPLVVAANDNRGSDGGDAADTRLAAITSNRVTLYAGGSCEPIADVSNDFAAQLALQGTGKLRDGRVLNIWGACNCNHSPCFKVIQAQWGTAGTGKPLQPFRTIAVDPKVVKLGSLLYVPLLEGRLMPGRAPWGGYIHDGCVVADDTGGHIMGNRIDLFVGRKAYFVGLGRSGSGGSHAWARHVPVFDGSGICERSARRVGRKAASI
jgi:3D (Asp-Asp-Asp) domain-containing protein